MEMPAAVSEAPDPLPGTEFVWEAFWHLSTDRAVGFSVGPIPWTAKDRYATRHGVDDPDDFAEFVELITAMDNAYQEHVAEQQEQRSKSAASKGGASKRR